MRRKDKEINNNAEIYSIMQAAKICRIAMCENNIPYIIPVNFGIEDNILYIHSALEGKKIDILKKNNNVCIEMDIDHNVKVAKIPCSSGSKYRSVIAQGKAEFIENVEEKIKGLKIILDHYSKRSFYKFHESQINRVLLIKIKLENITGKKSNY